MEGKNISIFFGDEDQELLKKINHECKKLHLKRSAYIKMILSKELQKEKEEPKKSTMRVMPDLMSDL